MNKRKSLLLFLVLPAASALLVLPWGAFNNKNLQGVRWQSSGWDSVLLLQWAQVQSLVRELRSCMSCGLAKKERKKERKKLVGRFLCSDRRAVGADEDGCD